MSDTYFVYKLIPPRATFTHDMAADEMAIMGEHAGYWSELLAQGRVVVFGPVLDPSGTWGLAVVEADAAEEVRALAAHDPAITSEMCTYDILPMATAIVRRQGVRS